VFPVLLAAKMLSSFSFFRLPGSEPTPTAYVKEVGFVVGSERISSQLRLSSPPLSLLLGITSYSLFDERNSINACFILTRNAGISSKYSGSDKYEASLICCLVMAQIFAVSPRVMSAQIKSAQTIAPFDQYYALFVSGTRGKFQAIMHV
jgi:hypothetical protein